MYLPAMEPIGSLEIQVKKLEDVPLGEGVYMRTARNHQTMLVTDAGVHLEEVNSPLDSKAKQISVLQALGKTVYQQGVAYKGTLVEDFQLGYLVSFVVSIPKRFWTNPYLWKKNPAAAVFFANLRSDDESSDDADSGTFSADEVLHGATSPGSYTLAACFNALPNHASDIELPELQIESTQDRKTLADLPLPVMSNVLMHLDAQNVHQLGRSCRFFRSLAEESVPDLNLSLYPHQRAAVRWMMDREAHDKSVLRDPCWRQFISENGFKFWGCTVTGAFSIETPRKIRDTRGGFFCDEPGLGKTVTGLALILQTLGVLPDPPAEHQALLTETSQGKKIGFYLLPATQPFNRKRPDACEPLTGCSISEALFQNPSLGDTIPKQTGLQHDALRPALLQEPNVAEVAPSLPMEDVANEEHASPICKSTTAAAACVSEATPPPHGQFTSAGASIKSGLGGFRREGDFQAAKLSTPHKPDLPAESGEQPGLNQSLDQTKTSQKFSLGITTATARKLDIDREAALPGAKQENATELKAEEMGDSGNWLPSSLPANGQTSDFWKQNDGPTASIQEAKSEHHAPVHDVAKKIFMADFSSQDIGAKPEGFPTNQSDSFHFSAATPKLKAGASKKRTAPASSDEDDLDPLWEGKAKKSKKKKGSQAALPLNAVYVLCELCGKWRLLPVGTKGPEGVWICQMHPDPNIADCKHKEEKIREHAGQFEKALGFTSDGQFGNEDFMLHFQSVLAQYPETVDERHSAVWWLSKQDPDALASNIQIPRMHLDASPESFIQVFTELGFVPASGRTPSKKPRRPSSSATPRSSIKRYTPFNPANAKYAAWRQPRNLSQLRFDTAALRLALECGVEEPPEKVFLSSATLLVVPSNLVQHWVHQVKTHVRQGKLRLLIISSDKERSDKMPAPHSLAWNYDLVITTMTQLSSAWASRARRSLSPFMQVHWLRVIVDEGHMLGNSLHMTNKLQMACALRADRRWLMTGTPTPGGPNSDTAYLQPLLAFLHNEPYGTEASIWQEAVQKPFEAKQPIGRERLLELLSRIMIRAAKADLISIPPLYSKVTLLDFAPQHAISYNLLVDTVHRNLLTSDWIDPDHEESMLNPKNFKWAKEMMDNIKKSCCVAGQCEFQAKPEDIKETLELLTARLKLPSIEQNGPPWLPRYHRLSLLERTISASPKTNCSKCQKCESITRIPMITPCAHLLCATCVSEDKFKCPLTDCQEPYKMQSVDDPTRKEVNPNPKWDVPIELIEWQCSYTQKGAQGLSGGAWSENWQLTESTKCVHLLKRLYEIGAATKLEVTDWSAGDAATEPPKRTKAIIFSQFWIHINLVISHLAKHDIEFAIFRAGIHPSERIEALHRFQVDDKCGVLLMDQAGAVGLDLSFVSYVFLLEPLEDMSLYKQVVSRAHRLGAESDVHVEILVMKGTAEEQLVRLTGIGRLGKSMAFQTPAAFHDLAEKDQVKAQDTSRRNHILTAMRRVREATLPDFHDLDRR